MLAAVACGPKEQVPPAPAVRPAPRPAPAAAVPVSGPTKADPASAPATTAPVQDNLPSANPNSAKESPIHLPLTEALHRYFEVNNRMPPDFNTLVAAKFIQKMPAPPPGKRFAIDRVNMQVVVVNQ